MSKVNVFPPKISKFGPKPYAVNSLATLAFLNFGEGEHASEVLSSLLGMPKINWSQSYKMVDMASVHHLTKMLSENNIAEEKATRNQSNSQITADGRVKGTFRYDSQWIKRFYGSKQCVAAFIGIAW